MNGFFFFPILAAVVLFVLAIRLHNFCENRQKLYRASCSEKLSLLFFNKLSLGSVFVAILVTVGETSFFWNRPTATYPVVDEQMWDCIETVVLFFLCWLCYHSTGVVDMKFRFTEVARKNKILEGIITASAGHMWLKDFEGRYIFCDHTFCHEFFGLSSNDCEVIGFNDMELLDAYRTHTGSHDFGDLCVSTDTITRDAHAPCHFIEIGRINGQLFVLDVIKTPLFDDRGHYEGCVGFAWPNRSCDHTRVLRGITYLTGQGKAKQLQDGVWQLYDICECPLSSHLLLPMELP